METCRLKYWNLYATFIIIIVLLMAISGINNIYQNTALDNTNENVIHWPREDQEHDGYHDLDGHPAENAVRYMENNEDGHENEDINTTPGYYDETDQQLEENQEILGDNVFDETTKAVEQPVNEQYEDSDKLEERALREENAYNNVNEQGRVDDEQIENINDEDKNIGNQLVDENIQENGAILGNPNEGDQPLESVNVAEDAEAQVVDGGDNQGEKGDWNQEGAEIVNTAVKEDNLDIVAENHQSDGLDNQKDGNEVIEGIADANEEGNINMEAPDANVDLPPADGEQVVVQDPVGDIDANNNDIQQEDNAGMR